jgi:hypothetical protein
MTTSPYHPSISIFRRIFLAIGGMYFMSLVCSGQENDVSIQFVAFPIIVDAEPVELLLADGKTITVELPTNRLSPIYKVKPMTQWALGKSSKDDEGEFVFETYGKAPSITSTNQLILVLRDGAKDSDGLKLIPMDNSIVNFGGGKYLFMNAATVDIAVEIGDVKARLEASQHKMIQPKPSKSEGKRKYLFVNLYFRKGKEAVPFYDSTWRYSENARCMVFFYHDPNTQQLRTHTIRDYLE